MKILSYFILALLFLSCSNTENSDSDKIENSTETEEKPFPKKYLNFYGGMSVEEFEDIAYDGSFTIFNKRQNWQPNEEEKIEKPGLTFFLDGITFSADYWDGKIAEIRIEGKGIEDFKSELQDVLDNFEGETKTPLPSGVITIHPESFTFERGDLRTIVDRAEATMILINLPLKWELADEYLILQKAHDKKVKDAIINKYQ